MFTLLDRYLIREIALPFAIALVVLTFVLQIPPILMQAEQLIARGVPWSVIARVLMTLLPQALSITIPMALLLGILIGLGRVSADREFVAMQACGVSFWRLMRPIGFIAALATAATAYQTIVALPNANQTFREIVFGLVATHAEQNVRPGVFFDEFPGHTIYVRDLPPGGGWRDVLIADTSRPNETVVYVAGSGGIRLDRQQRVVQLELTDVVRHTTFVDRPDQYEQTALDRSAIRIDPEHVFRPPPERGASEMTFAQLRQTIAENAANPALTIHPRFMIQQKLSLPATCPILALIALALGATSRKEGRLGSFVTGFAVIIVYYVFLYGARAAAMGGSMPPEWAPWVPNVVMGLVAVVLTAWRVRAADRPLRLTIPSWMLFWRRQSETTDTPAATPASPPSSPRPDSHVARDAAAKGRVVVVVRVPHFDLPAPRLLDLYVCREYLRVALLGVVSLLGIFYISTFIDIADELFRGEATVGMLIRYFFFQSPQFVYYVTPMALMVAALVTIGIMTKNSELLVMRACGISLYRTTAPILVFALLGSAFLFVLQERVLAVANREADRLNRMIRNLPPPAGTTRQWLLGSGGSIYHYGFFDRDASYFSHLQIYQLDLEAWRLRALTYVDEANYKSSSLGGEEPGVWVGRQGWVRELSPPARRTGERAIHYTSFDERRLDVEPPAYFAPTEPLVADMPLATQMTYGELQRHIAQLRASGAHVAPYLVELRRKISFPFVTVIITALAIPFAVTTGRRGAMYGIGIGIVLAIVYWIALSVFGALGNGGVLSPALAAWAPNILFGAAAAYMILTVRT